jgi:hypothetical protein
MTDEQKMQREQDIITLNYSRWSFYRRRAGLSTDPATWQEQRGNVLFRKQFENAELRRKHRARLEAEKAEKSKEK